MKNLNAIYLLILSNAISGISQGITMIAIPWYFISVISEIQLFGYVYFTVTLASLFWGPYAGTLIDRYDRQKIMVLISATGAVFIGILAFISSTSELQPWTIPAAVFAITVFIYNIHFPNMYAFAQEVTDFRHYGRITSYLEIQSQTTFAISGAIGAILLTGSNEGMITLLGYELDVGWNLEPWSLSRIFYLDASTYIASLILVSLIRYQSVSNRKYSVGSLKNQFREGINFLKNNILIFIFGNASFFVFATVLVTSFFLIPKYINVQLNQGANVYASSEMYFALGAIFAGFLINKVFHARGPVRGVIILTLLASLVYFLLVFNTWLFVFYLANLLLGLTNAGIRILRVTYIFKTVPNEVIGRLGSIFSVINTMFRLAFILLFSFGFFVSNGNIVYTFLILGLFNVTGVIILLYHLKPLRQLIKN